ncbi:MAG: metallophosphoesterase, partial [Pseudomonadota bacterium]
QTGVPHASYAVVERSAESMLGRAWSVVFHLVPYNAEPMAQRAEENGRRAWARALRTGWAAP